MDRNWCSFVRRVGGPQSRSGRCEDKQSLVLPRSPSSYTDWANTTAPTFTVGLNSMTVGCKEKERCEIPNSISGFRGCWSCFGFLHRVVVKCPGVSKQHTANIFRVTDVFSFSVSFEPIQSLWRWRQYVSPKRCNIWPLHSAETRHVIICRCSAAQQSAAQSSADSHNKWQLRISSSIMFCIVLPTPDIFIICVVLLVASPPLGCSPLQAVSVSRCSKFFGFQHVACAPPSV